MREDDFKRRYDALQRSISASEKLKERTHWAVVEERTHAESPVVDCAAQQSVKITADPSMKCAATSVAEQSIASSTKFAAETNADHTAAPSAKRATKPVASKPSMKAIPKRRKGYKLAIAAVAACLMVGLVIFGLNHSLSNDTNTNNNLFSVTAYATTTESAFDIEEDDMIVFPIDNKSVEFSGAGGSGEIYSGALFTVEGENVERVQATLSRGEIYSYEVEDFLVADNPEKAAEAGAWAPKLVGTGKYYKDYDAVARIGNPDERESDPYAHVRMLKRLGSTIDVPVEEGSPKCWGLWLDIDSTANTELYAKIGSTFANLEAMEGETLTITAQMTDGTFQTQVIELHAGWFKGEDVTGVTGLADVLPTGKPVPFDEVTSDGNYVHALYGTIQSTSNTPHPYSLTDANRYEYEIAPTKGSIENVLDFQGTSMTLEGVPEPVTLNDTDSVTIRRKTIYDGARSRYNKEVDVELSGLKYEVTNKLPDCFDLQEDTELKSFLGNIEYMNKCRMITHHFMVDENGTLNEGNSFVVVEYDLVNEGDEEVFISTSVGALCALDEENGQTVFATSGIYAAIDTGWRDPEDYFNSLYDIWLKPGEVNHVTVAYIAEDSVAQAENLALMVSPNAEFLRYNYEGELPSISDLQFVWL